jgi:hypothetical protein
MGRDAALQRACAESRCHASRAPCPARAQRPSPLHPGQSPVRCRERVWHRSHAGPAARPAATTSRCRLRALLVRRSRKGPLLQRLRGVEKGLPNILGFQIRIQVEYLRLAQAIGHHPHDSHDRDAKSADTGNSAHLVGTNGDPHDTHFLTLARSPEGYRGVTDVEAGAWPPWQTTSASLVVKCVESAPTGSPVPRRSVMDAEQKCCLSGNLPPPHAGPPRRRRGETMLAVEGVVVERKRDGE